MRIAIQRVPLLLLLVGMAVVFGPAVVQFLRLRGLGSAARDKRMEFETAMVVRSALRTAIESFRIDCKKLPPMTIAELASDPRWTGLLVSGNTTNECNECLVVALRHPDLRDPLAELPGRNPLGNTDGDAWSRVPVGCGSADAKEILDGYGNPIVYITRAHYGDELRVVRGDGETVTVRAVRRPDGTFHNPDGFQLISLGKNGQQNPVEPSDDIENFTR